VAWQIALPKKKNNFHRKKKKIRRHHDIIKLDKLAFTALILPAILPIFTTGKAPPKVNTNAICKIILII
jgi:hypothetical protein